MDDKDDKLILDLAKPPWARCDLDVNTMFDQKGEVALTRCGLQGEILLKILRQGYFYVSDITEHSEILIEYGFAEQSEEADTLKPFLKADPKAFEHIAELGRKLLKVRIPNRLKLRMDELGISNFKDLMSNKDKFDIRLRKDIETLAELISQNDDEKKENENIDNDIIVEKSDYMTEEDEERYQTAVEYALAHPEMDEDYSEEDE